MFSVLFEVHPGDGKKPAYLDTAKTLRPELEKVDGFVENIRYASLTRDGWILSVSDWRDEKSVVRWRTRMMHHDAQQKGREKVFSDYHLRVGQITADSRAGGGLEVEKPRFDATVVGGSAVSLITMKRPETFKETSNPADCAQVMGLDPRAEGILEWDVLEAVLTPGDLMLMIIWRDEEAAIKYEDEFTVPDEARLRRVRVVRDYGMFDRREAPQFYPDEKGAETLHS